MDIFHEGEIAVQERVGERAVARKNGRLVGAVIPEGARPFLSRQRMIAVAHGDLWATIVFGDPGFVSTEDGQIVSFEHGLAENDPIGLLAIDFESRKRLRINGVALAENRVRVREAYPNCPKYIQRRRWFEGQPLDRGPAESGTSLDAVRASSIRRTDTMFVASRHPLRGMDVSHRGGNPGFVHVHDNTLTVPDYPGNGMFNTLGNFEIDRTAGIAVMDFETGRTLQMSGTVDVSFIADDPRHPTGGTGRYWRFHVRAWRDEPMPPTYRWDLLDASPYNP